MDLDIRPLTPELWPLFDGLFATTGAVSKCWCMYWRIGSEYRDHPPSENRADFLRIVEEGPPPGVLAILDGVAVGWAQVTPRRGLDAMARKRTIAAVDDVDVWAISCFYVRKGFRRRGISSALVEAAVAFAAERGAPAVEAYPLDAEHTPSASFTGYVNTFEALGFEEVERRTPARPIMRRSLAG